jgi:ABC-2 type transport system ATP-binding protein
MTDAARGPQPVAELRGVHKRYGQVDALQGVDLELRPGELVALLGPNGAGKTTAVSIVLGQRRPDAGSAWLFGRDPTIPAARRFVGATPQEIGFPDNLKVGEVIDLVRAHYPEPASTQEVLARFGLLEVAGRRTRGALRGPEAAAGGGPGLRRQPPGGDPGRAHHGLGRGRPARAVGPHPRVRGRRRHGAADHPLPGGGPGPGIPRGGDLGRPDRRPGQCRGHHRAGRAQQGAPAGCLPELPGVARAERTNDHHTLYTADADGLVRALALQGVAFSGLQVERASLEEAFLSLTGGER